MKRYYNVLLILSFLAFTNCKASIGDNEVLVKGTDFDFSNVMDVNADPVRVKDFYISKNMVTRAEYEQFLKNTS